MRIPSLALALSCGLLGPLQAAGLADCLAIEDGARRLRCYDLAAGRKAPTPDAISMEQSGPPAAERQRAADSVASTLSQRWELAAEDKRGLFLFRPYKPVYLLPLRWSDQPNVEPTSSRPSEVPVRAEGVKAIEAKFQVSFKAKAIENMFGDNGDLWFGFTQQSNWQVYDKGDSAPFRETVYEPEIMAVWRTDLALGPLRWRMFNLALSHQSNGRSEPQSPSWNRVYAQFGFEGRDFALLVRPWLRVPESNASDDNDDIEDFMGRGDLQAIWTPGGHVIALGLRHSLRTSPSRGSLTLDWAFLIRGYLKGHLQFFTGYGESLIDYNHRQNVLAVGVSLAQWL